jgi:hypothetical protein
MKHFTFNKTPFTLGTSAEDNWSAILKAPKDAFWVHMEGRPSAHVIIHLDVEPTEEELLYAASLIKNQTKSAPPTPQQYVWSPVANLRLGSKVGEVIFKKNEVKKLFHH